MTTQGPQATNGRLDVDSAVRDRYSAASDAPEAALCCPVDYDPQYLEAIPEEILEKDYGCGDPSRYLQSGDVVLDLGSGGGKICYIASQVVGPEGRVIGVDINDDMLRLARKYREQVAERIGHANVDFRKGHIQDLALDVEQAEAWLREHPIRSETDYETFNSYRRQLRDTAPLIADESVDVVVSNCVLNLVRSEDKGKLFADIYRVLRRGGRAVISDIVADEDVPEHMQQDPTLWSGCISGAFREDRFLQAFERAGFYGIEILRRDDEPWQTVEGIEFRSVTVRAWKGKEGPCLERKQAVIYKGPWRQVCDDDGHQLRRGKRVAVCDKTFQLYRKAPYADDLVFIEPYEDVALEEAQPFDCNRSHERHPRETKGMDYDVTTEAAGECCTPGGQCC